MDEVMHYHQWTPSEPKSRAKVERNSKGYSWEITVEGPSNQPAALVAQASAIDREIRDVFLKRDEEEG